MKNLVVLFFGLFLSILFTAQPALAQDEEISREQLEDLTSSRLTTKSATSTTGSAFLNDDFLKGKMMLSDGKETATMNLRYDMENDGVQFLRNKEIYSTSNKKLNGFKIYAEPKNIFFKNGYDIGKRDINSNSLLRIAHDGKAKLLIKHRAILREDLASYSSATKKNKYEVYNYYFIQSKDGTFHEIKSGKKDVLNALSDHQDELTKYANSNNLDFDKESDLIKILKRYDKISN